MVRENAEISEMTTAAATRLLCAENAYADAERQWRDAVDYLRTTSDAVSAARAALAAAKGR